MRNNSNASLFNAVLFVIPRNEESPREVVRRLDFRCGDSSFLGMTKKENPL